MNQGDGMTEHDVNMTSERSWVVYGEEGSYSDYGMWLVRAFDNEDDARHFIKLLEAENDQGWHKDNLELEAWRAKAAAECSGMSHAERRAWDDVNLRPYTRLVLDSERVACRDTRYDYTELPRGFRFPKQ